MLPVAHAFDGEEGGQTLLPEAELALDFAFGLRVFGDEVADSEAAESALKLGEGIGIASFTGFVAKQDRSPFGKRLNQARLGAGLSQVQLAEQLGITQSAYAAWEREHISLKPAQIKKLCAILNVRVEELFEDRPAKRSGGPTGKARRLFEQVSELPRRQQQRILGTVEDMLIAQEAKAS